MALSAAGSGMGVGAGGGGMAINPGTTFGGNALAAPQTANTFSFEPPPSGASTSAGGGGGGGGGGAGGAYDLKGWEKGQGTYEDMQACLGIDMSTCIMKVCARGC